MSGFLRSASFPRGFHAGHGATGVEDLARAQGQHDRLVGRAGHVGGVAGRVGHLQGRITDVGHAGVVLVLDAKEGLG